MGELTNKIIGACRSLRQSYNIANKNLTNFFVKITSTAGEIYAKAQTSDICTLGKGKSVLINPDSIPQSVGIIVVDDETSVYMDLAGMVDFDAEIAKLKKSLLKTQPAVDSILNKMNAEGYEKNATPEFRAQTEEKLASLQKKVDDIQSAIENFEKLAIMEKEQK